MVGFKQKAKEESEGEGNGASSCSRAAPGKSAGTGVLSRCSVDSWQLTVDRWLAALCPPEHEAAEGAVEHRRWEVARLRPPPAGEVGGSIAIVER